MKLTNADLKRQNLKLENDIQMMVRMTEEANKKINILTNAQAAHDLDLKKASTETVRWKTIAYLLIESMRERDSWGNAR